MTKPSDGTPTRVLAADDSPLMRKLLDHALRKLGYEPVIVSDGDEALGALSREDGPRIALLDWEMPRMSGPEVCRLLRDRGRDDYVYAILLTANEHVGAAADGLAAGADDYLAKPFSTHELEARLRSGQRIVDAWHAMRVHGSRDPVTSLWDAPAMTSALERECARARREGSDLTSILVQLDAPAETGPHDERADDPRLLAEAASRLTSGVRAYDIVGRLEDGVFLVLILGCPPDAAAERARQLGEAVGGRDFAIGGSARRRTASVGWITASPGHPRSAEEQLSATRAALARAKAEGGNRASSGVA